MLRLISGVVVAVFVAALLVGIPQVQAGLTLDQIVSQGQALRKAMGLTSTALVVIGGDQMTNIVEHLPSFGDKTVAAMNASKPATGYNSYEQLSKITSKNARGADVSVLDDKQIILLGAIFNLNAPAPTK